MQVSPPWHQPGYNGPPLDSNHLPYDQFQQQYPPPRYATPQPMPQQHQIYLPNAGQAPPLMVPHGAPPMHRMQSSPQSSLPPRDAWAPNMNMAMPVVNGYEQGIVSSMASVHLHEPRAPTRVHSMHGVIENAQYSNAPAPSTAPLPTVASLQAALPSIRSPDADPRGQVAWIRDVLFLIERERMMNEIARNATPTDLPMGPENASGPVTISDPNLLQLADIAVSLLLSIIPSLPEFIQDTPEHIAEAIYLRATITASGAFPAHIACKPKVAFREFETAGRSGHAVAWFRLARDYESFKDFVHALQCLEHGLQKNDVACTYRLGVAYLLGHLGLRPDLAQAVRLLHDAATMSTITCPYPAYSYAMLLLDAVPHQISVPYIHFAPFLGGAPADFRVRGMDALKHLESAAYLYYGPAQLHLGRAYEFAEPPCSYSPSQSIQYYSLASEQGIPEADMALSKWYLGGAENEHGVQVIFKDEVRAFRHAERAARRGLPTAEFAMGYYYEVGTGTEVNIPQAIQWYEKAVVHGSKDAPGRLASLTDPASKRLSRAEHDTLVQERLVRSRTLARQRSVNVAAGQGPPMMIRSKSAFATTGGYHEQYQAPPLNYAPVQQHNPQYMQQQYQSQQQQYQPQQQQLGFKPRGSSLAIGLPDSPRAGFPHDTSPLPPAHPNPHPSMRRPSGQMRPGTAGSQHSYGQTLTPPPEPQISPDRPRYSLMDPGSGPSASPNMQHDGSEPYPGQQRSMPARHHTYPGSSVHEGGNNDFSTKAESTARSAVKYNTFAEMGIQGSKAEDKDCVIM